MIKQLSLPFLSVLLFTNSISAQVQAETRLQPYVEVLRTEGQTPIEFVMHTLEDVDLIIFDDALHNTEEPFTFYQNLIETSSFQKNVKYIFLEAISINKQQYLETYLDAETENIESLYPAFQDDFSGTGWSYQTYFDLLHKVYMINKSLPAENHIKVVGVSNPTYWSEIRTARDVELFRKTLISHDFLMYKTILSEMEYFKNGIKGIFLTNTRHAYKGIKNSNNEYYWNCGTFFHQWHPGKTFSIRFHNVSLLLENNEELTFKWNRMGNGIWDSAFNAIGNEPVAISLKNNIFGQEPYTGNHMLDVSPHQTMYDAYDALIFLAPLEELHRTAIVDFIYTEEFKKELARRYRILFTEEQIREEFVRYHVDNLKDLIEQIFVAEPHMLLPQAGMIGPMDAWRTGRTF